MAEHALVLVAARHRLLARWLPLAAPPTPATPTAALAAPPAEAEGQAGSPPPASQRLFLLQLLDEVKQARAALAALADGPEQPSASAALRVHGELLWLGLGLGLRLG